MRRRKTRVRAHRRRTRSGRTVGVREHERRLPRQQRQPSPRKTRTRARTGARGGGMEKEKVFTEEEIGRLEKKYSKMVEDIQGRIQKEKPTYPRLGIYSSIRSEDGTPVLVVKVGGREIEYRYPFPGKKRLRRDLEAAYEGEAERKMRLASATTRSHIDALSFEDMEEAEEEYKGIAGRLSERYGGKVEIVLWKITPEDGFYWLDIEGVDVFYNGRLVNRYNFYPNEVFLGVELERFLEFEEDIRRLMRKKAEAEEKGFEYVADVKVDVADYDPNEFVVTMTLSNAVQERMDIHIDGLEENANLEKTLAKISTSLSRKKRLGKISIPTVHWTKDAEDLYLRNRRFEEELGTPPPLPQNVLNKAEWIAGDSGVVGEILREEKKRADALKPYRDLLKSPWKYKDIIEQEIQNLRNAGREEEARYLEEASGLG
jgi:PAS domain-containing protein